MTGQERGVFLFVQLAMLAACSTIPVTETPPVEIIGRSADPELPVAAQTAPCTTCVWAVHDPLFAADANADFLDSKITVRATTTSDGFESLVLNVTIGEIVACEELPDSPGPTALPCSDDAEQQTVDCLDGTDETNVTCKHKLSLSQSSLVSYQAVAVNALGMSRSTPMITFAYGEPPDNKARPIWWHGAEAAGGAELDRLKLGFFPHSDYAEGNRSYSDFAADADEIIGKAFFNDDEEFASSYTANRHLFDLWAAPFGATFYGCTGGFDITEPIEPATQLVDSGVLVHHRDWGRDCADIEDPPGNGTVHGNTKSNGYLLVHESGHFLMGLGDEYDLNEHMACSNPPNVYLTEADCAQVASAIGADENACVSFPSSAMWRIDEPAYANGLLEVMDNEGGQRYSSTFQKSSGNALGTLIQSCLTGDCYVLAHNCVGP